MLKRLRVQERVQFASKLRHCKPNSHRTGHFVELLDEKQALFLTGRKTSEDISAYTTRLLLRKVALTAICFNKQQFLKAQWLLYVPSAVTFKNFSAWQRR
jgi:hypothetical protein